MIVKINNLVFITETVILAINLPKYGIRIPKAHKKPNNK
jgi:hypothetical protein